MNDMTEADLTVWKTYLETVRIDFPIRVRLKATLALNQIWITMVDVVTPDVFTGAPRNEFRSQHAPTSRPDEQTKHWIKDYLLDYLLHEFGENLYINDDRPFNPHTQV